LLNLQPTITRLALLNIKTIWKNEIINYSKFGGIDYSDTDKYDFFSFEDLYEIKVLS
jgi:hypothetical protein